MSGNYFDGLAMYESQNCFLFNLQLSDNGYAGFSGDLNFNGNLGGLLYCINNEKEGMFLRNSRSNNFSRCFIKGNKGAGVFLAKSELENSAVTNSIFGDFFFAGNSINIDIRDKECVGNQFPGKLVYGEKLAVIVK